MWSFTPQKSIIFLLWKIVLDFTLVDNSLEILFTRLDTSLSHYSDFIHICFQIILNRMLIILVFIIKILDDFISYIFHDINVLIWYSCLLKNCSSEQIFLALVYNNAVTQNIFNRQGVKLEE